MTRVAMVRLDERNSKFCGVQQRQKSMRVERLTEERRGEPYQTKMQSLAPTVGRG